MAAPSLQSQTLTNQEAKFLAGYAAMFIECEPRPCAGVGPSAGPVPGLPSPALLAARASCATRLASAPAVLIQLRRQALSCGRRAGLQLDIACELSRRILAAGPAPGWLLEAQRTVSHQRRSKMTAEDEPSAQQVAEKRRLTDKQFCAIEAIRVELLTGVGALLGSCHATELSHQGLPAWQRMAGVHIRLWRCAQAAALRLGRPSAGNVVADAWDAA